MKFLILTALVFGIFAISLGVIPVDAVDILGIESGMINLDVDYLQPDGFVSQPVTVTLNDADMNTDPNIVDKISFPTSFNSISEIGVYEGENVIFKKIGGTPQYDSSDGKGAYSISTSAVSLNGISLNPATNGYWYDMVPKTPNSIITLNSGDSLFLENAFAEDWFTQYGLFTTKHFTLH